MAAQQRRHDRRLAVGVEVGPVHRHRDVRSDSHDVGHPADQQRVDIDGWIGQQPVHLFDRMLGQAPAGQRQALADHGDRKRSGLDHPKRGPRQREHAFGMQVVRKQRFGVWGASERKTYVRALG